MTDDYYEMMLAWQEQGSGAKPGLRPTAPPAAEVALLPAPPANPERIRAELAKLGPVARQSLAVGGGAANRTWAKRILERVAAGEHVGRYARESAQVAMGLRAKVSAI